MKSTLLKISVSQDGLLPQETAEIATLEFPTLPKKLLKALGFERVDSKTYVGVLPVFINLGEKEQEIEIELGVTLPEMRKKIIEIVKTPARLLAVADDKKAASSKKARSAAPSAEEPASDEKPAEKKVQAAKKTAKTTDKSASAKKTATKTVTKTTARKTPAGKTTAKKEPATKAKRAKKG